MQSRLFVVMLISCLVFCSVHGQLLTTLLSTILPTTTDSQSTTQVPSDTTTASSPLEPLGTIVQTVVDPIVTTVETGTQVCPGCCLNGGYCEISNLTCTCYSGFQGLLCCVEISLTTAAAVLSDPTLALETPPPITGVPDLSASAVSISTSTGSSITSSGSSFHLDHQSTIATIGSGAMLTQYSCPQNCCSVGVCDTNSGVCVCPTDRSGADCCTVLTQTPSPVLTQLSTTLSIGVDGFSLIPSVGTSAANAVAQPSEALSFVTHVIEEIDTVNGNIVAQYLLQKGDVLGENISYHLANGAELTLTVKFYAESSAVHFGNASFVVRSAVGFGKAVLHVAGWPFAAAANRLRFSYLLNVNQQLYGVAEIQDDPTGAHRFFRWRSKSNSAVLMGVFVFAIADDSAVPIGLNYALTTSGIRVVVLLPHFSRELLFDPDLSILLSDQDTARFAAKHKRIRYVLAGSICGGVLLLTIVTIVGLYLYMRKRPSSFIFHADLPQEGSGERISPRV